MNVTRRACLTTLLAPCAAVFAAEERALPDFVVEPDGFGDAGPADIVAVTRSAAGELWRHCGATRFRLGFRLRHNPQFPITLFDHSVDGRIVIGLNVKGTFWAQFAYQFAHEFAHALMDHSNDWTKLWRETKHANQWLAESLCETASLFSLRAMAKTWETKAPYPNWTSFAPHLASYAKERMEAPGHQLPEGKNFAAWFRESEPAQRLGWTRERNTIIAKELLPLFEAEPAGWDCLSSAHRCRRDREMTLADFLGQWRANAAPPQRAFVGKLAAVFGIAV